MKRIIFIIICCFGSVIMVSGQEQQAQKLLSEAIYQEEVNGKLDEAIKTYQLIINKYPDNRKVSAEALLHLGLCYEKLGNQEAVKTYKRLVNNFPEQKNQVAVARERLSRLILVAEKVSGAPLMPKFTKINIPSKLTSAVRLSPDGKNLGLISDSKIWMIPLFGNLGPGIPGNPVQINTEGINVEYTDLCWSHDGKWIAFNDPGMSGPNQKIYIVPSKGGKPRELIENYRDARIVNYKISLSPDGNKLAFSSVENNKQHIYSISTEGGNPVLLTDMQAREPAFSPDGKLLAYVEDKELGAGQGDCGLWMVPVSGGTPSLVAEAGMASSPIWSPDGNMIAFLDLSQGKFFGRQIIIVPVSGNGKNAGKVTRIDVPEGIEDVRMLAGWTPDNKLGALFRTKQEFNIYTLPSNGGQTTIIQRDCYALQPRWSHDGKQIFFATPPEEGDNRLYRLFLASVPAAGGNAKALPKDKTGERVHTLNIQGGNRVSPDGKWIVSAAATSADTSLNADFPCSKIWKIAIDGSASIQITNFKGDYADLCPSWSPDGKKVAFKRTKLQSGTNPFKEEYGIYIIDSSGGEPELLTSVTGKYIFSPVWSPDGKMIAYLTAEQEPNLSDPIMNVIDVITHESRKIGKVPTANVNIELAWSPDSKQIAFNGKAVHVMNINDGSIKDIKTNLPDNVGIWHLDWSPDGKQFVFAGGNVGTYEFWLMENFLPLEKLAQKNEKENVTESEGIRIKQIWKEPYTDFLGTVSFDGRLRTYVYWGEGDVAVHNLVTGENQILTHEADLGDSTHFAQSPVISKDGSKIAYYWWNPYHTFDLRLIDVDDPSPSLLLYRQEGVEVYPVTWLSNKELIAIRQDRKAETTKLTSFNILNGTFRDLKTFDGRQWAQLSCSPDEKYIAYDFVNEADNGNRDINILPVDGSSEISIIKHPANDRVLGWVPGRKEFLFISDRSGTWDLWATKLDDGKPDGPVKRIYTDIGEIEPMGFTENGNCFFGFSRQNFYTSVAPFNIETGEVKEESGKSIKGSNFGVKWSPDGKYLTYIKETENSLQLTVQNLKTGEERKLADSLFFAMSPCWSPDGNSIMVVGREQSKLRTKGYKGGVFLVDVKTGKTTEVFLLSDYEYNVPNDDAPPLSLIEWDSDSKSFYYLFFKDRLVKHDLETGEDKILYKHSNFEPYVLKLAPDGKRLLFGLRNPGEEKSRLLTMSAEGGKEKEVCTAQEAKVIETALWSPDGKYIYFAESPEGTNLWRVPAEGGKPQKVWHSENRAQIYSIHPDGNQIVFNIRERTTEVRVIENLVQELEKLEKLP